MIPEYKYQVKDYSLLTPLFKQYMVAPLFRIVPWWIPANIITIVSNLFMYAGLVIALYVKPIQPVHFLLVALFILMYAIGDHFDGMQAKRTKTSSALGEFFDHYLDAFNNGILMMIIFLSFEVDNPFLVVPLLVVSYLAHAAIFSEQFSTGWLIFEKIGSLEALFFTIGILVLSCFKPVYDFLISVSFFNLKNIELVLIASASGTIVTFFKTIIRAKISSLRFYGFCLLLILVASSGLMVPSLHKALPWIVTLYSACYIGRLMRGHLADNKERLPDFLIPVTVILALWVQAIDKPILGTSLIILLLCFALYTAICTIYTLRKFWVWTNPKL